MSHHVYETSMLVSQGCTSHMSSWSLSLDLQQMRLTMVVPHCSMPCLLLPAWHDSHLVATLSWTCQWIQTHQTWRSCRASKLNEHHASSPCAKLAGCIQEQWSNYGSDDTSLVTLSSASWNNQSTLSAADCCTACAQAQADSDAHNDPSEACNIWNWWART